MRKRRKMMDTPTSLAFRTCGGIGIHAHFKNVFPAQEIEVRVLSSALVRKSPKNRLQDDNQVTSVATDIVTIVP